MLTIRSASRPTLIALLTLVSSLATAQTPVAAPGAAANKLVIDGTSNLHEWSCTTTTINTALDLEPNAPASPVALPKALKAVRVRIPVKSLKCDHDGMNDNTYKALKADKAPEIIFTLTTFDVTPEAKDAFVVHATGSLTIAGQTQTVTMDVSGTRLADGSIKASATVPIKMTDYGISPPTAIFGTLRTGNEVKITFEIVLGATTP